MKLTFTKTVDAEKVPTSCSECPFWQDGTCRIPMSRRGLDEQLLKPYLSKRHKDCPLQAD